MNYKQGLTALEQAIPRAGLSFTDNCREQFLLSPKTGYVVASYWWLMPFQTGCLALAA